jgi:hypothetical protein
VTEDTDNRQSKSGVRRTTIALVLVAVAFYAAFIVAQIVRSQGGA